MRFTILGSVEALNADRVCTPAAPKVRQVLALLLYRAGKRVRFDSIIDELWGDNPPRSAMTTAQTYIYHLRRLFEAEGVVTRGEDMIETSGSGYILHVDPTCIDDREFHRLVALGRDHMRSERPRRTLDVIDQALDLWTGTALGNITCGAVLSAYAVELGEQKLQALQMRVDAELALGMTGELVGELRRLVLEYPLNEWFHARLIHVLHGMGRRCEALQSYHLLTRILRNEVGLSPSADLQRLHYELLSQDVELSFAG
jgi:SARP family transcriptional regulator, regulator of embCAB operon